MTDTRPEITARADGANVVVRLRRDLYFPNNNLIEEISVSPQECFALQCQLSAAMEQANLNAVIVMDGMEPAEEATVKFREWF